MKPLKPLTALKRKPKTLVELFRDPRRWTKNELVSRDGIAACVLGGANFLCCGNPEGWNVGREIIISREVIISRIAMALGSGRYDVVPWNNNPALTHREFLRVLKKAKV